MVKVNGGTAMPLQQIETNTTEAIKENETKPPEQPNSPPPNTSKEIAATKANSAEKVSEKFMAGQQMKAQMFTSFTSGTTGAPTSGGTTTGTTTVKPTLARGSKGAGR